MSADFWAGYISGAAGIVIGNPLDIAKVKQQVGAPRVVKQSPRNGLSLLRGTAAPILGYGALNALLFVSYNRTLNTIDTKPEKEKGLASVWVAGAIGGLATFVVSAPTELVKCRAQMSLRPNESSISIVRRIWEYNGIKGLYFGGVVTALRDAIGYGFYFWAYELATRSWPRADAQNDSWVRHDATKTLMCGGMAGVMTWASVFPLDVIKSRVQTQPLPAMLDALPQGTSRSRTPAPSGAIEMTRMALKQEGHGVLFRGLTVCSLRAFIVNAVQWAVYEWVMSKSRPSSTRNQDGDV